MANNSLITTYRSTVYNTADPEGRNRVQLVVPNVFGPDVVTGWVWPTSPHVPAPAVGSLVYAVFENGDPNNPLYLSQAVAASVAVSAASSGVGALSLGGNAEPAADPLGTAAALLGAGLPTDNNTARVTPPLAGASAFAARLDHVHPRRVWLPKDHGLLAWTEDVGMIANATSALGSGSVNMNMLIPEPEQIVLVNLDYLVVAAAVTPTANQCPMGVYKSDGTTATLIATTADQGTNLTAATSSHKVALTVVGGQSLTVPAGTVLYTAVLWNGTTGPTLGRVSSNNLARNYGLSAGAWRSCSSGSGQTSLPTTITLSGTTTSSGSWQGVS